MMIPTLLRAAAAAAMLIASSTIAPKIMFSQSDPSSGTVTVTVTAQ